MQGPRTRLIGDMNPSKGYEEGRGVRAKSCHPFKRRGTEIGPARMLQDMTSMPGGQWSTKSAGEVVDHKSEATSALLEISLLLGGTRKKQVIINPMGGNKPLVI